MAKNNVKTIINTLNSKLRKNNITNTDKKEIKQAYTQLATEIQNGYKLGLDEITTIRGAYSSFKEDVTEAITALPPEQQLAFAEAIKTATAAQTQEQQETTTEEAVIIDNDEQQETTTEEDVIIDNNEQQETTTEEDVVIDNDEQQETTTEEDVVINNDEQQETTEQPHLIWDEQENDSSILTEEEKNKYLDEIRSSHTLEGYIATIEAPISRKNIEAALALKATMSTDGSTEEVSADDNCAMALANVDDMLVAMDYCAKNDIDDDLDGAIISRLRNFRLEDITPDNAYALLALADKIKGNSALYDEITSKIATALYNYDNENFGNLSEQDLSKNYTDACEELKDFIPLDADKEPTLWSYTFTDDNGNVLKNKNRSNLNPRRWISGKGNDAQTNKEAILNMARELAAQELAQMKPETDPEKRKEQLNKVMNDKIAMLLNDPSGKTTFTQTEIAAKLAVGHTKAETFRNRITQRFKNSKWGKDITARLQKLDKQLTDTYGKKYTQAKKYTKMLGKIGLETVKGSAMFAIAGLANPVGIPALIAYNTVKQWKTMKDQLTDPSISTTKKCAMLLGAGITTTLGMVTAASGLSGVTNALGLNTPAMLQTLTNAGTTLGIAGRTAVSTMAATVPNWVEKASIYFKKNSLKKQMANLGEDGQPKPEVLAAYNEKVTKLQDKINQTEAQIGQGGNLKNIIKTFFKTDEKKLAQLKEQMVALQKQAPKDMATLLAEEKVLDRQAQMNRDELIGKTLGSGISIGLAQTQVIPSLINSAVDQIQETTSTAAHNMAAAATEHGLNPWAQEEYKAPWQDANHNATQAPWLTEDNILNQMNDQTEIRTPYHEGITPDEISGVKASETNLEAAKAENSSGIEGKSSFAHTLQHLETLGDSRIADTNAVAEGLSEHIGKDANLATIACKMAPHALQDVLHIEGLPDNNPTSYNMIQYLANNDLTPEQTTALNNFIQQNFEGVQFKTENFADYQSSSYQAASEAPASEEHQPAEARQPTEARQPAEVRQPAEARQPAEVRQPVEASPINQDEWHAKNVSHTGDKLVDDLNDQYAQTNNKGSGYKFEPVEPTRPQTIVIQEPREVHQTIIHHEPEHQQTEIYTDVTPQSYADAHGLIYDPLLSNGVNNIGGDNHGGYKGAFINPKDGSVIMIPNDPVHDKPFSYPSIAAARESQNNNTGAYSHSNHSGLWYDPDKKITRCWGSGNVTHNNTINKIITAVNAAGAIYSTVKTIQGCR